jgi:hypothetical protein
MTHGIKISRRDFVFALKAARQKHLENLREIELILVRADTVGSVLHPSTGEKLDVIAQKRMRNDLTEQIELINQMIRCYETEFGGEDYLTF